MIYIGIDPGLSGALAIIRDTQVFVWDTPTLLVKGDKIRRKPDTVAMASLLRPYANSTDTLVVLEAVHSMPAQGVSSSFSFGEGLGVWKGIIAAFGLPLELVSPQRWKKTIMADMGKGKDAARLKAKCLFPIAAEWLSRVKDDGRAEALLMAEYGRRLRKGE